jgi:hypothetical protein
MAVKLCLQALIMTMSLSKLQNLAAKYGYRTKIERTINGIQYLCLEGKFKPLDKERIVFHFEKEVDFIETDKKTLIYIKF